VADAGPVLFNDAFAAASVERIVAFEVADLGTAAAYIRNGLGIWSILDDIGDAGLVTVPIADQELMWRLYVTTSANRRPSAAVRSLLTLIEERAPEPDD
jgi:DNA-binding transcriptional LysR family regulator